MGLTQRVRQVSAGNPREIVRCRRTVNSYGLALAGLLPGTRPKLASRWQVLTVPQDVADGRISINGHAKVAPEPLVSVPPGDRPSPSDRRRIRVIADPRLA